MSSLTTLRAIALNTYREIIRERLLYGVLITALLLTVASFFLATISLGQNSRVLQDIGLATIQAFTLFICVFVATNSIHKDAERRAWYLLFSKPISRGQYILGKYLGFLLLLLTTLVILGGIFILGTVFLDTGIALSTLFNLSYAFLEISLLIAVATLLSTFTAALNASLYTIAFFFIGHSLPTLRDYAAHSGNAFLQFLTNICYYLLPNLNKFDIRQAVLYHLPIGVGQVGWSVLYWLLYTGLALWLAVVVIKKQEV